MSTSRSLLEATVERLRESVVRRCATRVGWQHAEDVGHEVLLRFLRASLFRKNPNLLKNEKLVGHWIKRIIASVTSNFFRGEKKRQSVPIIEITAPIGEIGIENLETIAKILERVPANYREAWRMKEEGKTYAEIGKILGQRPGTIGVWICRAREIMIESLAKYDVYPRRRPG